MSMNTNFGYTIVVAVVLLMLPVSILQSCATVIEKGEGYRVYECNKSSKIGEVACPRCGERGSQSRCRGCGANIRIVSMGGPVEVAEITTSNQELITKIAMENKRWLVRKAATEKITDQKVLAEIVEKDTDGLVRLAAVKNITDQKVLEEIAKKDSDEWVRKAAVRNITDQKVLEEIAKKDSSEWVRRAAIEKLSGF